MKTYRKSKILNPDTTTRCLVNFMSQPLYSGKTPVPIKGKGNLYPIRGHKSSEGE
jgi:hypothetical protein